MEKIKRLIESSVESEKGKSILIVLIVILVGLGSFELGRLSKENGSSGIKILSAPAGGYLGIDETEIGPASTFQALSTASGAISQNFQNSAGKAFFGSTRGSKYYSLGCSAGKTIKMENRIYFATSDEAEGAGYELSSSCK